MSGNWKEGIARMPENVRNVVKRGVVVAEQEASKGRTVGSRGAEEARRAILGPPSLWESSACQPSSSQGGGGRGKGRPTFWKPLSFAFTIKLSLSQSQFSFPNPFSEMRRKSNNELDITLNWNHSTLFQKILSFQKILCFQKFLCFQKWFHLLFCQF